MASKRLSILIVSMLERSASLGGLLDILRPQLTGQVELLVLIDNKGMSIGAKRNILIQKAQGDYVCFIDDDDTVDEAYVSKILDALEGCDPLPDCVGFNGQIIAKNGTRKVEYSLKNRDCVGKYENETYFCGVGHITPIKRSLAVASGFPEVNHSEDSEFWNRVKDKLKTEVFIDTVMYNYLTRGCVKV